MIPNKEAAWDEIPYLQLGAHPGYNELGTGKINHQNIFKFLYEKDFDGIVGMELGKSIDGKEGKLVLIEVYVNADDFKLLFNNGTF